MKKSAYFLIPVIICVLMISAGAQERKIQSVNAPTLKAWMGKAEKVTVVDVGALLACMDAKIPGAVCLPCDEAKEATLPMNGKLVIYSSYSPIDADCALIRQAVSAGLKDIYILEDGLVAWRKAGNPVVSEKRIPRVALPAVKAGKLVRWQKSVKNSLIIDIRSPKAYGANHLGGSINIPLDRLHVRYAEIPMDRSLLIVDQDGKTGLLAASYLTRKGFPDVKRLQGGMAAFKRGTR